MVKYALGFVPLASCASGSVLLKKLGSADNEFDIPDEPPFTEEVAARSLVTVKIIKELTIRHKYS